MSIQAISSTIIIKDESLSEQLKLYKKRDLEASQSSRILCKLSRSPRLKFRQQYAKKSFEIFDHDCNTSSTQKKINSNLNDCSTPVARSELVQGDASQESCQSWIQKRRKLRKDLNLIFNHGWLERKPDKTLLEEKVLKSLKASGDNNLSIVNNKTKKCINISQLLPLQAVTKLAIAMKEDKLLLNIFTLECDVDRISKNQCKMGLEEFQKVSSCLSDNDKKSILDYYFESAKKNELFVTDLLKKLRNLNKKVEKHNVESVEQTEKHEVRVEACAPRPTFKRMTKLTGFNVFSTPSFLHGNIEEGKDENEHGQFLQKSLSPPCQIALDTEEARQDRIDTVDEIRKKLDSNNIVYEIGTLEKVLLYPGDKKSSAPDTISMRQPMTLSKDFWKKRTSKSALPLEGRDSDVSFGVVTSVPNDRIDSSSTLGRFPAQRCGISSRSKLKHEKLGEKKGIIEETFSPAKVFSEETRKSDFDMLKNHELRRKPGALMSLNKSKHLSVLKSLREEQTPSPDTGPSNRNRKAEDATSPSTSDHSETDSSLSDEERTRRESTKIKHISTEQSNASVALSDARKRSRRQNYRYPYLSRRRKQNDSWKKTMMEEFLTLPPKPRPRKRTTLSTGVAYIGSKVDCWLPHHLRINSSQSDRVPSDPCACWPGRNLDKLRLLIPSDNNRQESSTFFYSVNHCLVSDKHRKSVPNKGITWPINGKFMQNGNIELNKVYSL